MSLAVSKKRTGRELPLLIDNLFTRPFFGPSLFDLNGLLFENDLALVPSANIIENGKDYEIELAAPGLERKDFKVEVENDTLIVSAEKEEEKKTEDKNYRSREFSYNSFYRTFSLPKNLKVDNINAEYHNGVLKITLPKKEPTISKPIKQIKVN
ncbi:Hsp20/alpha crystallin family protein [Flavobacterium aquariorum]|uniref:Hsp20/alpha crystallin family protein n=1 Tax=Flavobacterium aquariorum TaxID=2217670 RepID=A0A2W7TTW8_9FLAO|nr:Hsp20/alpha crystallin family protein [Flavobacterium aquariorum]PZX93014.1 Hsp20/alpha crystallin family protein [Flavobacterium aquariorum]